MTSVTFVIARPGATPDDEDIEIEGEVTGTLCAAEPDVGIMSNWAEDACFTGYDGKTYELTEAEEEHAIEKLCEAADDYPDYED